MSLRERTRPGLGIIEPCLPSPAKAPPSGRGWIHEIKHDGFRIMARRDGARVRLITRHGNDFTARFPLAVEAVSALSARSFLLDGEAIVTNERGLAVFDLIRHQRHGDDAVLIAFDLIELDGEDLRRTPIEQRKRQLAKLVRRPQAGIVLNEVFEGDGDILFAHACKLGCEGIVSKRLGSPYRSGRSPHWVKVKNPKAPAVKREAEEDWGSQLFISRPLRRKQALPAHAPVRPAVRKKSSALSHKPLAVCHKLTSIFVSRTHLLGKPFLAGRQSIIRRTSATQFFGQLETKLNLGRRARHGRATHCFESFGEFRLNLADLFLCFSDLFLKSLRNFVQLGLITRHDWLPCCQQEPPQMILSKKTCRVIGRRTGRLIKCPPAASRPLRL
jgi:bifunctional non-homologous end joining protein LigD